MINDFTCFKWYRNIFPSGSGKLCNSVNVEPGGGLITAESISISQISFGRARSFFCDMNSDVIPIMNGVGASKS